LGQEAKQKLSLSPCRQKVPFGDIFSWVEIRPLNDPEFFVRTGAVLAGSAAVKHFFPEDTWKPRDVDLFVSFDKFENTVHDLKRFGWESRHVYPKSNAFVYSMDALVTQVHLYRLGDIDDSFSINLVGIGRSSDSGGDANDLCGIVHSKFDLDGCAVCWDGKEWHVPPAMGWDKFLQRQWIYKWNDPLEQPHMKEKMELRCGAPIRPSALIAVAGNVTTRIVKYEKRGFTISNRMQVFAHLWEKVWPGIEIVLPGPLGKHVIYNPANLQ